MQRIPTVDRNNPPEGAKDTLDAIKSKFGKVPNIFATVAHSPAALKGFMGLMGSLGEAKLGDKGVEAVALRVGEMHGCKYCTAAHTAKSKMLGVSEEETIAWRQGRSEDARIQAILDLATLMVNDCGQVTDEALEKARVAGLSEAELIEIVAAVTVNTFTNYINALVKTDVDFPKAPEL